MHSEVNKSGSVISSFTSFFLLYLFVPIMYHGLHFNQINIYFFDYYGEVVLKYNNEPTIFLLTTIGATIISFYTIHYFLVYYTFFSQKTINFLMLIFVILFFTIIFN